MLGSRDIDDLSNRPAGRLSAANNIRPGDRVAIILQNCPSFVIATIAAWNLGAIVVGLNPMYRKAELEKLFADCTPRAMICHDDQWPVVVEAARHTIGPDLGRTQRNRFLKQGLELATD